MTSVNKRKELVNELRKAHFHLGFQKSSGQESEYDHKYREYPIAGADKDDADRRAHHYELGSNSENNYTSEFKERYPAYQRIEKFELPKDKIDDLRKQHFALGFDTNAPTSTYKENYYKKSVPVDKAEHKDGLKKHNHDFGDSLTYFSSTYNEQHNKNMKNHAVQPKPIIDSNSLRKTNMVLGNELPNYQTQNSATYTQKDQGGSYQVSKPIGNVDLGKDSVDYRSTHKDNFTHKPSEPHKVDKQKILDFKSAHFKLGSPNQTNEYRTEFKAQFQQKPLTISEAASGPGTNVQIAHGDDSNFSSTYKDNFQGSMAERVQPCKIAGELNSVSLGTDPNNYVSEGMARYVRHPLANNALDADKRKALAGTSLQLGNQNGDYSTQHKDTYVDKFLQLSRAGMSEKEIKDLKAKHFELGNHNGIYGTSNAEYGTKQGPANKLAPEVQRGMRQTNMYDHDPDIRKTTTYVTSYHFKKNNEA